MFTRSAREAVAFCAPSLEGRGGIAVRVLVLAVLAVRAFSNSSGSNSISRVSSMASRVDTTTEYESDTMIP